MSVSLVKMNMDKILEDYVFFLKSFTLFPQIFATFQCNGHTVYVVLITFDEALDSCCSERSNSPFYTNDVGKSYRTHAINRVSYSRIIILRSRLLHRKWVLAAVTNWEHLLMVRLRYIWWSSKGSLRVLIYEAKLQNSDGYSTI